MIQVEVAFISIDARIGSPIVFLRELESESRRLLPIWIGQSEALAIQLKLKNEEPPRPFTHDLLKNVIEKLSATVDAVHIHTLRDETFFASVILKIDDRTIEVDSRSSDAIAIAQRFDAPILTTDELLAISGFPEDELKTVSDQDKDDSKSSLEELDEEFLSKLKV